MATEYIGSRYVPKFTDNPNSQWTNTVTYEPLTIVLYQGNSYTSRQFVPIGIDITNTEYWAETGNYNAQIEAYRQEVQGFDGRITTNATNITTNATNISNETVARQNADTTINNTLNEIQPLDTVPMQGSTKGVTSGGVYTAINDVSTTVDNLPDYINHDGIKVLVFGDSTFITNGPTVTQQLSSLDSTLNVKQYAIGGSTYSQIQTQLSNAQAANDLADADYIIVASGTNNWQSATRLVHVAQGDDAFISDVRDICEMIATRAQNAQVLLVGAGWASNASYKGQIWLNDCGCSISAYNDIIEGVAGEYNFGCLRLDRLLSINEKNYFTKMLTSNSDGTHPDWDGIYVHYTSKTATHIARAILACIYGINGNTAPSNFIDITPPQWTTGNYNYYYYAGYMNSVGPLSASNLQANTTYWVTAFGGATTVTNNGTVVAESSVSQGIMQFPVTTDSNGALDISMAIPSGASAGNTTLFAPMLSLGRPSVLAYRTNRTYAMNNTVGSQIGNSRYLFWSPDTNVLEAVTIPTDASEQFTTKLMDLPSDSIIENGCGIINFVISGTGYYSCGVRVNKGSVYMSETINISNPVTGITNAQLILIGSAPS